MSFLLDTDICSAYLKGNRAVSNRFLQYTGGLAASSVTVGELYTWAHRATAGSARLPGLVDMLREVEVVPVDLPVAETFGKLRAGLLDRGIVVNSPDLLIAATALHHDLTIVTHNVRHFGHVPGLRMSDWLVP